MASNKLLRRITLLVPVVLFTACAEELPPQVPPRQQPGSPFHYPEDLWDAGVEGETLLRIFVGTRGSVDTVRVERGSGYAAFDSSAVEGAKDLRFEPARRGTESVGAWVLLPVQFDIPGTERTPGGNP